MTGPRVPYAEIDPPIVPLVRALNRFPGIHTVGSCGGHENPTHDQAGPGRWWVLFTVDRTDDGWVSLEFLAWAINRDMGRSGSNVAILPDSAPPWMNEPGRMLRFLIDCAGAEGPHDTPQGLGDWLTELKRQFYVTARQASRWETDASA